jgi:aspartyl-tRNA(Asn)/glutamyl-tRNA(Gln) amidotransferase subunit C
MAEKTLDKELVLKLAQLARLNLSNKEIENYTRQLKVILDAFKELKEINTDDIEPSYHPLKISYKLREDIPEKWDWDPLSNVVDKEKRFLRGPKIK